MKILRVLTLLALILSLCMLCVGCNLFKNDGDDTDTDTDADTDTDTDADTDEDTDTDTDNDADNGGTVIPPHTHTSTKAPISQTPSSCCVNGSKKYLCDICGKSFTETLPLASHTYKEQYNSTIGYKTESCTVCSVWRMKLSPNQKIEFAALCRGSLSLTLDVGGAGAEVITYRDGAKVGTTQVNAGAASVSAGSSLPYGGHTFGVEVKNATGDVYLTNISVNGSLHRKDGVILELTNKNTIEGGSYNDFYVYTQTSDPSGNYYIRYRFRYFYSTTAVDKVDTANNIDMFRIFEAHLVKVDSVSDTAVSCTVLNSVLTSGEIAVAIREKNSVDFIGGYHGEEHIVNVSLEADGVKYTPKALNRTVVCSYLNFKQLTVMNRCNTPGDNVLNHDQDYSITSGGINCKRTMEWLKSGYEYTDAFLNMFTARRIDKYDTICETVETLDENGRSLGKQSITSPVAENYKILENPLARTLKYSSATSGYSAEVGFSILNGSVAVDNVHVLVRRDAVGDNKWYASFKSTDGSKVSKAGERWELDVFYNVDYVAGQIPAHVHTSNKAPVSESASTCTVKGRKHYDCDVCGKRYYEETQYLSHSYQKKYNPTIGYECDICTSCEGWRIKAVNGTKYEFVSYSQGNIDLTFSIGATSADITVYLDGKQVSSANYKKGSHTISVAKLTSLGEHMIGFTVKNADGSVYLTKVAADGELHQKDAIILEMTKTTSAHGGKYNDFYVYVRTSDSSGDYYIRYQFKHEYNTTLVMDSANTANNNNMFRILAADLVKVSAVSETNNTVTYTKILSLLNGGEVAVAVQEVGAVDFIGGFHGEENIKSLKLTADGVEYTPGDAKKVVVCSSVELNQLTVVNRCNTPSDAVFEHGQIYRITTGGIKCNRTIKWLMSGFNYSAAYLNMFTLMRSKDGTPVCNTVETFDKDGNSLGKQTINTAVDSQYSVLANSENRYVEYTNSTNSGFTAKTGFEILNGSCTTDKVYVAVRKDSVGDNKWYASFKSADGSKISTAGELWELDVLYHIDYVKP